jgi:hypothetical protein
MLNQSKLIRTGVGVRPVTIFFYSSGNVSCMDSNRGYYLLWLDETLARSVSFFKKNIRALPFIKRGSKDITN